MEAKKRGQFNKINTVKLGKIYMIHETHAEYKIYTTRENRGPPYKNPYNIFIAISRSRIPRNFLRVFALILLYISLDPRCAPRKDAATM